ncbi:hypothetical protein [Nannocystis pusilla]|uniref:hypothetical protein n=1 Tax=Nannocystis pusilla TaxID=889268 RepID=UPI003BF00FB6
MHRLTPGLAGFALVLAACTGSARPPQPVPEDSSPAAAPAAVGPADAGGSCSASAACPGAAPARCAGRGEGRCRSEDGVGCRFEPKSGPPQVRCCDGSETCTFTPLPGA